MSLLVLQAFMATIVLTMLPIAALVGEIDRLREAGDRLWSIHNQEVQMYHALHRAPWPDCGICAEGRQALEAWSGIAREEKA